MTEPPPDALPIRQPRQPTGLNVHHHEKQTYHVTGGETPHWVWYDGNLASCDCADFIWRDTTCKHISAVHHEESRP